MKKTNRVFIATSIDGYIADKNGSIDWLHGIPNPDQDDMGYTNFMAEIDAIVMGRTTYETVLGFDIEWPYSIPVFVLSNSLTQVPEELEGKVHLVKGALTDILDQIHQQGLHRLYIDGGATIRSFLAEDLIDEMIITTIPILLGGGTLLFGQLDKPLDFASVESKTFLGSVAQQRFIRSQS